MSRPLLLLLLCGIFSTTSLAAENNRPPNVVVIFCDDLGYGELPVYRNLYLDADQTQTAIGSFTPIIDRLAKGGVVCTRAYGNNHCVPSRMSLLSGMWPMRSVTLGGQPLIGRSMREAGLKTAHFGKYHHEIKKTITLPYNSKHLEFDEFFGFEAMSNYFRKAGELIANQKNSPITYRVGEQTIDYKFSKDGAYMTDTLTNLSVDFIHRCARDDRPFFLYLPYNAPHTPIQAKDEDLRTLFPKQVKNASTRQRIMAMMYAVDRGVGQVIKTLKDDGQLDNTLIIFTGDNNGEENLSLTYPLHGYKHEPFDGGFRVPCIVWSKALESSATKPMVYDGLVSSCDILPTALKYVKPSNDLSSLISDGTDIMPYLLGQKPPLKGRLYLNTRTLNHRSNTWDGGKDTKGETVGYCITLIADDYKIMKLWQDAEQKDKYSYAFHHLPNMISKQDPKSALREDYYRDTASNPEKKAEMIKRLEEIQRELKLH